ncbi:hypothetical protein NE237_019617 [Protea cynaroides]|uniref:Uncharacterized protein n=1 Tax=Protea cynaroides TaxID=273540 RepID=A0A9Q0H4H4_9MAGN|nr:hypothetical protein NE237_019617 [Protea cynaroides]
MFVTTIQLLATITNLPPTEFVITNLPPTDSVTTNLPQPPVPLIQPRSEIESETGPDLFFTNDNMADDGNRTTIPVLQPLPDNFPQLQPNIHLRRKKNLLLGLGHTAFDVGDDKDGDAYGTLLKSGIALIIVLESAVAHRPWPANSQLLWPNPLQIWEGVASICKSTISITTLICSITWPASACDRSSLPQFVAPFDAGMAPPFDALKIKFGWLALHLPSYFVGNTSSVNASKNGYTSNFEIHLPKISFSDQVAVESQGEREK